MTFILSFIVAFGVAAILGQVLIPLLHRLKAGQAIREDGLGKPTSTNALVATATAYIHQHYRDPDLTVSKLAQYAYVSREHLSRVFKEYTKQSVHDYLTELRMQGCRQDIADGKRILAACTENGFSDYSSFLKTFHKLYGLTPMEYRAQVQAEG